MRMRMNTAISTTVGNKRPFAGTHLKSTTRQHHGQHRILKQKKLLFMQLKWNMTVSKVISSMEKLKRRSRANPQQPFWRCNHFHLETS